MFEEDIRLAHKGIYNPQEEDVAISPIEHPDLAGYDNPIEDSEESNSDSGSDQPTTESKGPYSI
jgi:hypothetical protein